MRRPTALPAKSATPKVLGNLEVAGHNQSAGRAVSSSCAPLLAAARPRSGRCRYRKSGDECEVRAESRENTVSRPSWSRRAEESGRSCPRGRWLCAQSAAVRRRYRCAFASTSYPRLRRSFPACGHLRTTVHRTLWRQPAVPAATGGRACASGGRVPAQEDDRLPQPDLRVSCGTTVRKARGSPAVARLHLCNANSAIKSCTRGTSYRLSVDMTSAQLEASCSMRSRRMRCRSVFHARSSAFERRASLCTCPCGLS
eukprot:1945685-Prymnesium_polylepis.1